MSVGQLDATTVKVGVPYLSSPAGTRTDFTTQNGSIGKLVIKGITTGGTTNFMTNSSQILAWLVGTITFGDPPPAAASSNFTPGRREPTDRRHQDARSLERRV